MLAKKTQKPIVSLSLKSFPSGNKFTSKFSNWLISTYPISHTPKSGVWEILKELHLLQWFWELDSEISTVHLRHEEWHFKHTWPVHIWPSKQSSFSSQVLSPFLLLIKSVWYSTPVFILRSSIVVL